MPFLTLRGLFFPCVHSLIHSHLWQILFKPLFYSSNSVGQEDSRMGTTDVGSVPTAHAATSSVFWAQHHKVTRTECHQGTNKGVTSNLVGSKQAGWKPGKAPGHLTVQRIFRLWPRSGEGRENPHSNLLWNITHPQKVASASTPSLQRGATTQHRGSLSAQPLPFTLNVSFLTLSGCLFPSRRKLKSFESSALAFLYLGALSVDESPYRLVLRLIHEVNWITKWFHEEWSPPMSDALRPRSLSTYQGETGSLRTAVFRLLPHRLRLGSLPFFTTVWLLRHIFWLNQQDLKETFF